MGRHSTRRQHRDAWAVTPARAAGLAAGLVILWVAWFALSGQLAHEPVPGGSVNADGSSTGNSSATATTGAAPAPAAGPRTASTAPVRIAGPTAEPTASRAVSSTDDAPASPDQPLTGGDGGAAPRPVATGGTPTSAPSPTSGDSLADRVGEAIDGMFP